MNLFSPTQRREALLRRRIKFVVEKGAMARLFRKGGHAALKKKLGDHLKPRRLACIRTRREYDGWLNRVVGLPCWGAHSRNGLAVDRWAYFAKLINIVVYEIVTNRELFTEREWKRLRPFLHVPVDAVVLDYLLGLDPGFPAPRQLKGMTRDGYWRVQHAARRLAHKHRVPAIWFEAAWAA